MLLKIFSPRLHNEVSGCDALHKNFDGTCLKLDLLINKSWIAFDFSSRYDSPKVRPEFLSIVVSSIRTSISTLLKSRVCNTLNSAPSTSRLKKWICETPASSKMSVNGRQGTSTDGRLLSSLIDKSKAVPSWRDILIVPAGEHTPSAKFDAHGRFTINFFALSGCASISTPFHARQYSKRNVLLKTMPSKAPISRNVPPPFVAK